MDSFKGTSSTQDIRFGDKERKLLKTLKFPKELNQKVDMRKVELSVMKPWIAKKVIDMLGFEDEVVIEYVSGLLEDETNPIVDGRKMMISLLGFLESKTEAFMTELWALLLSAQESPVKVPAIFIEQKKEEMKQRQAEKQKTSEVALIRQANEDDKARKVDEIRQRERQERRGNQSGSRDFGRGNGDRRGGQDRYERRRDGDNRSGHRESYGSHRSDRRRDDRDDQYRPRRDRYEDVRDSGRDRRRSPSPRSRSPPRRRRRSPSVQRESGKDRGRDVTPKYGGSASPRSRSASPVGKSRRRAESTSTASRSRSRSPARSRSPPRRRSNYDDSRRKRRKSYSRSRSRSQSASRSPPRRRRNDDSP